MRTVAIFLLILSALFSFCSPGLAAYSERIAASTDEIWKASREVLEPYGLDKEDLVKRTLQTEWIVEKVVRENSLLRGVAKKEYLRKTRYRIDLRPMEFTTEINIKATFQYRPSDAPVSTPWRSLKPSVDDGLKEKDLFFSVLHKIEDNRRRVSL